MKDKHIFLTGLLCAITWTGPLFADEHDRLKALRYGGDVEVITLGECDRIPPKINEVAVVASFGENPGSWPCDYKEFPPYQSSCWRVKHLYKKEVKALVVKKYHCSGAECFKEVIISQIQELSFGGPAGQKDKQKSLSHMQAKLDQYLAEKAVNLCNP
jgi:hypothetical protein